MIMDQGGLFSQLLQRIMLGFTAETEHMQYTFTREAALWAIIKPNNKTITRFSQIYRFFTY